MGRSSKGKLPYITLNGEDVADSYFCIRFLKAKFNVDMSAHLTPLEKANARAYMKMAEESIRWAGVVHRFRYGKPEDCGIPPFFFKLVGNKMLKETEAQGYGKHSQEECKPHKKKPYLCCKFITIFKYRSKCMKSLCRTFRPWRHSWRAKSISWVIDRATMTPAFSAW
jgi:hypothetical protein